MNVPLKDTGDYEAPVPFESAAYEDMIAKSLLYKGNNRRLKAAIAKARNGLPVTLAYIGGSITQGAGAEPLHTHCYAYRSFECFKDMFVPADPAARVQLIKAGLGGTPSELGVVRYERDVLREDTVQPDIVIVEFAVNDADDETEGICYESLVLKALNAPNRPAVILLFSVFENNWNLQDRLAPVGWHYELPMVSIKDAVLEQFYRTRAQGGVITKKQFFHDIYHPTNAGHRIMADALGWLFRVTDASDPDTEEIDPRKPPVIGNAFTDVRLLDRLNAPGGIRIAEGSFTETDTDLQQAEMDDQAQATPQFPNNWMHTGETGNAAFTLTLASRRLILVYKDSASPDAGTAEIRVDGKLALEADPHKIQWTHCHALLLYDYPESAEHTVEIKMAAGHEQKRFTILGFGYVS